MDAGGFRFGHVLDLLDPNFLSGGARYGDLPALLVARCAEPGLDGRTETAEGLALADYQAVNAERNLTRFTDESQKTRSAALEWLMADG